MKKNNPFGELFYRSLKKTLLIMRIAILFLVLGILQVHATDAYSQKTRLSLNFSNAELIDVLDEIEEESGFYFLYNEKLLDTYREVDITADNQLISNILDNLFAGTDVKYSIIDSKIILAPEYLTKEDGELAVQQQQTITGTVTDAKTGEPMVGVNVRVKGSTIGAITDIAGKYSLLSEVDPNATLVFSFIGYQTMEVPVAGRQIIDIQLVSEVLGLEEVVVIGYGTVKKSDLTGAVSSIKSADLVQSEGRTRVDEALVGKMPGVQVQFTDGEPGSAPKIIIRGVGSITAGTGPLYVVDGMPVDNIDALNMKDIENINILKDASSTAIYGSRGANGVVIITTKRGTEGSPIISFDVYSGWQKVSRIREMLNSYQQAKYFIDGLKQRLLDMGRDVSGHPSTWDIPAAAEALDVVEGRNTRDVNPLDYVLRTAPTQNYSLSVKGSANKIKYSLSGEYLTQDGIIIESDYKRLAFRSNLDIQINDKLKVNVNLNPTYIHRNKVEASGHSSEPTHISVIGTATTLHNYFPILASDEEPQGNATYYLSDEGYYKFEGYGAESNILNPVAIAKEINRDNTQTGFLGNLNIIYNLLDELSVNAMLGGYIQNVKETYWRPNLPDVFYGHAGYADASDQRSWDQEWIMEYILNYDNSFGGHNLSAMGGFTAQKNTYHNSYFESNRFSSNYIETLNAASEITGGYSNIYEFSLMSYLARLNYNYNNRYYFTSSVRMDGSSRFGSENRWGTFPSVALTWRVSEESFMGNIEFVSDMKIRASLGATGNHNIGNYEHLSTVGFTNFPAGSGYVPTSVHNPYLGWEKQRQWNFALETSLFNGRLNFNIEYFNSLSSDLLLDVNIPRITGFNSALKNVGEVRNRGWEFSMASTIIAASNFRWATDFNISGYKNKVLSLDENDAPIISSTHITQVGRPIGMFRGWIVDEERPIFLNWEMIAEGPVWAPGTNAESRPGDRIFVDVNGDGHIGSEDRVEMGSPYPDFYYGMTNNFSYKNLSLAVSLNGVQGNQIFSESARSNFNTKGRMKSVIEAWNYWMSEDDIGDGKTPRPHHNPIGGNRQQWGSWALQDGSFLRISNINLSYEIPDELIQRTRLNIYSVRVYCTAINPFIFTNFNGFNPEVSHRPGDNLRPGMDLNDYPIAKSIVFGVNMTF